MRGKKEVFSEAKGEGFDVKVLKEILRLRKQDKDERDEQESLLDLYLRRWRVRAHRKHRQLRPTAVPKGVGRRRRATARPTPSLVDDKALSLSWRQSARVLRAPGSSDNGAAATVASHS